MRKITILEILDPIRKEFIPVKQAINQGLFNPRTYLFFNPVDKRHHSISEAAKLGLFKSAIDAKPEALIIEKVKLTQSVYLLSARDPINKQTLVPIRDAIDRGIVDIKLKVYRDFLTNKEFSFSDAIDKGLIKVKIARETTEKIIETLTEQKIINDSHPNNNNNFNSSNSSSSINELGLIKRIETSSKNNLNDDNDDDDIKSLNSERDEEKIPIKRKDFIKSDNEEEEDLKEINGFLMFDRTKSLSINKHMKKYNDEILAGFISEKDFNKQSSKHA
jgi:hypothetical protein